MMGMKERSFAPLTHVSLEELVPQNHFYRYLESKLDLSFVRSFVQESYAGLGRPSIVVNWANIRMQILASGPLVRIFIQKTFW